MSDAARARVPAPRPVFRLDVVDEGPLDRRSFCRLLGACAAGLALSACVDGDAIETGPLGGGGGAGSPDAGLPIDGAPMPVDGGASACGTSPVDVGAATRFALDTATLVGTFFVVRDARGLYAVSSQCTHRAGVTVAVSGSQFRCPRHGAIFTREGAVVSGPVSRGLVHYAVCTLPGGTIGVSTAQTVATDVRLAV